MIIENIISSTNSKNKKRNFKEMISQITSTESEFNLSTVQDIYKFYPCKKKKFSEEIHEYDLQLYRDIETLNHLQRDLKNLKLKGSQNLPRQNFDFEKLDLSSKNSDCDCNCDMPEIIDIPIDNENEFQIEEKIYYQQLRIFEEQEDDTNDSSDTNSNFGNEISLVRSRHNLKEKLIDNAIKTEKTLNKIFNNLNPQLQPNSNNGIILYEDMKKIKENIEKEILIGYIVSTIKNKYNCENQRENLNHTQRRADEMEIEYDDYEEFEYGNIPREGIDTVIMKGKIINVGGNRINPNNESKTKLIKNIESMNSLVNINNNNDMYLD